MLTMIIQLQYSLKLDGRLLLVPLAILGPIYPDIQPCVEGRFTG